MAELVCPNCDRTNVWIGAAPLTTAVGTAVALRCGSQDHGVGCLLWFSAEIPSEGDPVIVAAMQRPPSARAWRTKTPCPVDLLPARLAYHDPAEPERACEHCGQPYRGPAEYCSIECADADA